MLACHSFSLLKQASSLFFACLAIILASQASISWLSCLPNSSIFLFRQSQLSQSYCLVYENSYQAIIYYRFSLSECRSSKTNSYKPVSVRPKNMKLPIFFRFRSMLCQKATCRRPTPCLCCLSSWFFLKRQPSTAPRLVYVAFPLDSSSKGNPAPPCTLFKLPFFLQPRVVKYKRIYKQRFLKQTCSTNSDL